MTPQIWYHGGKLVSDWSRLRWDRERSVQDLNAAGPGMYWTTDPKEASGYAEEGPLGVVYEGVMRRGFRKLPEVQATRALPKLQALYARAPEDSQATFLSNWSLEHPASAHEVRSTMQRYAYSNSLFDALVALYHDLFQYDADAYVRALQALGYDGYILDKGVRGMPGRRKHLILWNPSAMDIR
jgi:hypothetical protein